MTPYDPRAAALDALAAMRFPDVSEPPAEHVEAVEKYLWAVYALGRACTFVPWQDFEDAAWSAGREGRPLVPPV